MRLNSKIFFDRYLGGALLFLARPLVYGLGLLLRRDHSLPPRGDIAIIKLLGAGSLIIALPNLLALRRRYPDRRISLVTTRETANFRPLFDVFDEIILIEERNPITLIATFLHAWFRLFTIDTVIDLEVYSKITTLFALSLLSRNRISFYPDNFYWKHKIATHLVFFNQFSGVFDFYDQMFGLVGVAPLTREETRAELFGASAFLRSARQTIGIAHACSPLHPERQLTPGQWLVLLSRHLAPTALITFELFGAAADKGKAERIIEVLSSHFTEAHFVDASGTYRIADLAARISTLHEFWTIDTSLLHIARLTDTPVVSIWGPSDPATRLRWRHSSRDTVLYTKVPCSPCVHISDTAPCRGNNICIQALASATEYKAPPHGLAWVVS